MMIGTSVPQDLAPVSQYKHIAAVASFRSHTSLFRCHGDFGVLCGFEVRNAMLKKTWFGPL